VRAAEREGRSARYLPTHYILLAGVVPVNLGALLGELACEIAPLVVDRVVDDASAHEPRSLLCTAAQADHPTATPLEELARDAPGRFGLRGRGKARVRVRVSARVRIRARFGRLERAQRSLQRRPRPRPPQSLLRAAAPRARRPRRR
jgi:hypothetical protein